MNGRASRRSASLRSLGLMGISKWFQRGAEMLENIFIRDEIWQTWLKETERHSFHDSSIHQEYLQQAYKQW